MPFEYEALVGHLYIVGGRAVRMAPPGALCEVAPEKAARGRETDTFFALVTPTGDAVAPASFYERLAALAAERYFSSSGSVTAGLRDLFTHLNQNLYDYNQTHDNPYEANIVCAVLRGADLIVGRVGSCATATRIEGLLRSFPDDLNDDEALYVAPLGVREVPDVKMTQYRVSSGQRMLFADANLADLKPEEIDNALMSVDVASTLVAIKELARLQMTVMVVEFVPPEVQTPETVPAGESTTAILQPRKKEPQPSATITVAAASPDKAKPPPRERKPGVLDVLWRHGKRAAGRVVMRLGSGLGLFGRVIDHFFGPRSEDQRRWLASPVGAGTVIALPVIVVAAVLVMWLSGTEESEFELCLQEVDRRVELARSPNVVNSDRQSILTAWGHVLTKVQECETMRPGDPGLASIRAEGQAVTDRLRSLTRIEPVLLATLREAQLTRVVVQGQNLFVLDANSSLVYQLVLTDDGLGVARPPVPIQEMRRGGVASGYEVGTIVDIAYNTQTNRLIAIDESGVLVQCEVRFLQCTGERLIDTSNWGDPVAITTWGGNGSIYVLDSEAQNGQIWRYDVAGGSYGTRGGEYFGATRPVLRGAVDLQIDQRGNIYVLLADGTLTKHFGGQAESFVYISFPDGQDIASARALFVDDTVTAQSIYIVDQTARTIYETSFIGNFRGAYRTFDESLLALMEDVAVGTGQDRQEIMYVVSGNTIFAMPKPEPQ
ncbi:MAG: hypothetical protein ACOCXZ_00450 [Chloroflexota bacterium]